MGGRSEPLTRNVEAVEDCVRRVRAVEVVEMDSGGVVVQEIVTLVQGEVDSDAVDRANHAFRSRCQTVWLIS
jgi:hypothetical protein